MKSQSAIAQMYYGKRGNIDAVKSSNDYKNKVAVYNALEKELIKRLADFPELAELYKQVAKASDETHYADVFDFYVEGFRFGLLLGLDAAEVTGYE